ncbi:MAG: pilin [bacterium]|nr:pilin [bacterium]
MKKISRFAALVLLAASFSVPLLAVAETTLNSDYCNSTGRNYDTKTQTCVSNSGGININVLRPYSESIIGIINTILVPVLIAIAFITFLWGIFKYFIWGAESESDKADGRKFAMWGIIGFVILFSLWALVNIVSGTLGLQTNNSPRPPTIGTP